MRIVPYYYVVLYYFLIRRSDCRLLQFYRNSQIFIYTLFLFQMQTSVRWLPLGKMKHHIILIRNILGFLFKLLLSCLPHSSNFQATNNLSLLPSSSTSYKRNTAIKFYAQNMNNNSYCGSQFLTWRAHFRVYVLGCTQQKLQSDKTSIHLAILLFGFFKLINQIRTLWSVIALNFLPYKYCL